MRSFTTLLLMLLASLSVLAQSPEPISADRPGFANGSGVVGDGVFQVEVGVNVDSDLTTLPTLLRYGLTDTFELRVESDVVDDDGDLAPADIGFKWQLTQGSLPLSIIAGAHGPSGEGALKSDGYEAEVRLVSDIDLGNDLTLTPNVGVGLGDGGEHGAVFAVTLEKALGNALPFVDFETQTGGGNTSLIADGGLAWIVGRDSQLDISGGAAVRGNAYPDWFVSAGYSHRF